MAKSVTSKSEARRLQRKLDRQREAKVEVKKVPRRIFGGRWKHKGESEQEAK